MVTRARSVFDRRCVHRTETWLRSRRGDDPAVIDRAEQFARTVFHDSGT